MLEISLELRDIYHIAARVRLVTFLRVGTLRISASGMANLTYWINIPDKEGAPMTHHETPEDNVQNTQE